MKNLLFKGLAIFVLIILFYSCTNRQLVQQNTVSYEPEKTTLVGPKKKLIVIDFENKSAYGQQRLGKGISDVLTTELSRTNNFILVEREKLQSLINEQILGETGLVNQQNSVKIGNMLGADAIITGSITQFGTRTETYDVILTSGKKQIANCAVDLRIVDVSTGQIVWAGSGAGEASVEHKNFLGSGKAGGYDETLEGEAFRAAIVKVMKNLIDAINQKIEWKCYVAKVTDTKKLYLSSGKKSNLDLGMKLGIFRLGEEIIDPSSGIVLAREETKIGEGVVSSFIGEDASILEYSANTEVKTGDICKIF